jgi:hypothetical protein
MCKKKMPLALLRRYPSVSGHKRSKSRRKIERHRMNKFHPALPTTSQEVVALKQPTDQNIPADRMLKCATPRLFRQRTDTIEIKPIHASDGSKGSRDAEHLSTITESILES